ncbi:hypothetical protein [Candidatus Fokinia crypta]|uniref:Uncharacterized protein n=1 Tax=Candidatus Fokinia crypta TaxID=1920990 RepID=A0ABZ0UPA8_9RICK|nr:hypothetical protein [Candidatus Fokinia cryptica]WPX97959.1 hypothetical protein Fokcrypt_00484 [Candidatus Fokinia cryptica]
MNKNSCKKERLAQQLKQNLARRKEVMRSKKKCGAQSSEIKQDNNKNEN